MMVKVIRKPVEEKTFAEVIERLEHQASEERTIRIELERQAREALACEERVKSEIQYMKAIQLWAGGANPTMDWVVEHIDVHYRNEYVWRDHYHLRTARLDFSIMIGERTDMKKFKYEVRAFGTQITHAPEAYKSSYVDTSVVQKLTHDWRDGEKGWSYYPSEHYLDDKKKFAKLDDAKAFLVQWKDLVDSGLKDIIEKDYAMLKLALAQNKEG